MAPNPVIQEFLTEELNYFASPEVARGWMNYSAGNVPSSRDREDMFQGQAQGISQSSLHVSSLCTNLGNLLRRPGLGNRKMSHVTTTDPEAYALAQGIEFMATMGPC